MLIHAHCTASFSHILFLFLFSFVSFLFLVAFLTGYLPFTRRKLHTRFNCRGHAQCTVGLICTGAFHYSISKRWNYRKTSVGCWEIGNKTIRGISPYYHILQPAQQQLAVQIFWNLQWTKEKTGRCLSLSFVVPFKCNKIQPDDWNWHLVGAKHWFTRFYLFENGKNLQHPHKTHLNVENSAWNYIAHMKFMRNAFGSSFVLLAFSCRKNAIWIYISYVFLSRWGEFPMKNFEKPFSHETSMFCVCLVHWNFVDDKKFVFFRYKFNNP